MYKEKPWELVLVEGSQDDERATFELVNNPSEVVEGHMELSHGMAKHIESLLCLSHWMKDMKPTLRSDRFQAIRTPEQLRAMVNARGYEGLECFILLNCGARSSKQIFIQEDGTTPADNGKFAVHNSIDETEQILDYMGLFMESNIGKAMVSGAFWTTR